MGSRFRPLVGTLVFASFALGCVPEAPVVHEAEVGSYTLRYQQLASRRVGRTLFEYDFAATLERVAPGGLAGPVAVEVTAVGPGPSPSVEAGLLDFPAATPGPVAAALPFTLRLDRRTPFDPSQLAFAFEAAVAPVLLESDPEEGATVARSVWPQLVFSGAFPLGALSAPDALVCDGTPVTFRAHALAPESVVLNPEGELPGGADCTLDTGSDERAFQTAAGPEGTIVYDRTDDGLPPPFPDDTHLVADPTTPSGWRVQIPPPTTRPGIGPLFRGLTNRVNQLDGFSPQAGFVVLLSEAPDVDSLPFTPAESIDPLSSIALFDVDPTSPDYGQRMPFELNLRSDQLPSEPELTHQLIGFPSKPLRPLGRYALVVTRRALAEGLRPFGASPYFEIRGRE